MATALEGGGYRYAKFLFQQDEADDRSFADKILEATLAEAQRHEMSLWIGKLQSLRREMAIGPASQGYPNRLSEREVDVLRLVAEGMTDKQIGDRLFISPKTVGNHVTPIREKTACHNRADIFRAQIDLDSN